MIKDGDNRNIVLQNRRIHNAFIADLIPLDQSEGCIPNSVFIFEQSNAEYKGRSERALYSAKVIFVKHSGTRYPSFLAAKKIIVAKSNHEQALFPQ